MMDEDMLTDGPFCPDSTSASRFDADLLRIRKVGVVLRVQVPSSRAARTRLARSSTTPAPVSAAG